MSHILVLMGQDDGAHHYLVRWSYIGPMVSPTSYQTLSHIECAPLEEPTFGEHCKHLCRGMEAHGRVEDCWCWRNPLIDWLKTAGHCWRASVLTEAPAKLRELLVKWTLGGHRFFLWVGADSLGLPRLVP